MEKEGEMDYIFITLKNRSISFRTSRGAFGESPSRDVDGDLRDMLDLYASYLVEIRDDRTNRGVAC